MTPRRRPARGEPYVMVGATATQEWRGGRHHDKRQAGPVPLQGPGPGGRRGRSYLAVVAVFFVVVAAGSLVYSGAIAASASSANFRCAASNCSANS